MSAHEGVVTRLSSVTPQPKSEKTSANASGRTDACVCKAKAKVLRRAAKLGVWLDAGEHVDRDHLAPVTRKPLWRMVISAMGVASGQKMKAFETVQAARTWLEEL